MISLNQNLVAGDGEVLTDAGVQQMVQAMASFAVPSASQTQYTAAGANAVGTSDSG